MNGVEEGSKTKSPRLFHLFTSYLFCCQRNQAGTYESHIIQLPWALIFIITFFSWATKRLFPTMINFISASNSKLWLLGGELGDRCVGFDSNKMEQNTCVLEIFIWFQKITTVKFYAIKKLSYDTYVPQHFHHDIFSDFMLYGNLWFILALMSQFWT